MRRLTRLNLTLFNLTRILPNWLAYYVHLQKTLASPSLIEPVSHLLSIFIFQCSLPIEFGKIYYQL